MGVAGEGARVGVEAIVTVVDVTVAAAGTTVATVIGVAARTEGVGGGDVGARTEGVGDGNEAGVFTGPCPQPIARMPERSIAVINRLLCIARRHLTYLGSFYFVSAGLQ